MLNLTQHAATPEQLAAGVIDPTGAVAADIRELLTFDQLPSRQEIADRARHLADLARSVLDREDSGDAVMIGGAPYLMAALERALAAVGIEAHYAFSVRESVEQTQQDGSVRKVNIFRHAGFVPAA